MNNEHSKIVRFNKTGEAAVLEFVDEVIAAPAPDEIVIDVRAIGLNRAEVMMRRGAYLEQPEFPSRLGYEASGIVVGVGESVTGFKAGDRVSTIPAFSMSKYGIYGERVNVPAFAVAHVPDNLSDQEATSVWMAMITAYGALVDICKLSADKTIMITAASSSVGVAAIQLTKMLGAKVIATTRGPEKVDALTSAGADSVIQTNTEDLVSRVNELTNGNGVNAIFDAISGPIIEDLASASARGGIIVEYGALDARPTPYPLGKALQKGLTIVGYTLFELTQSSESLERAKAFVLEGLTSGHLKPVIDKEFSFEDIQAAHEYMEAGQQFGKIVVNVNS